MFNSLRGTHTSADSVHRDSAFVYDTYENSRFCAQGLNLCSSTLHDAQNCRLSAQRQRFRLLVCVTVYVLNVLVQCFSFNNLCNAQKRCRFSAQGQRIAHASLRDCMRLDEPVQFLLTAGARRHRFYYVKLCRRMAMHGQND